MGNHYRRIVHIVIILLAFGVLSSSAYAKGGLQLEGVLTAVKSDQDELSFQFSGRLTFAVSVAIHDRSSSGQLFDWDVKDLPIRVSRWTTTHNPNRHPQEATFEEITRLAEEMVRSGHLAKAAIDNPQLSFDNTGKLLLIEGSRFWLYDLTHILESQPQASSTNQ